MKTECNSRFKFCDVEEGCQSDAVTNEAFNQNERWCNEKIEFA